MKSTKSLLDAGAGTCSVYGELLRANVEGKMAYAAFGGYNPDYLRYCGERGVISFDHDWTNELPFCKNCAFDLIVQLEGLHHTECKGSGTGCRPLLTTFDNFDKHLACGGSMWLEDVTQGQGFTEWTSVFRRWLKNRPDIAVLEEGHISKTVNKMTNGGTSSYVLVQKTCTA